MTDFTAIAALVSKINLYGTTYTAAQIENSGEGLDMMIGDLACGNPRADTYAKQLVGLGVTAERYMHYGSIVDGNYYTFRIAEPGTDYGSVVEPEAKLGKLTKTGKAILNKSVETALRCAVASDYRTLIAADVLAAMSPRQHAWAAKMMK